MREEERGRESALRGAHRRLIPPTRARGQLRLGAALALQLAQPRRLPRPIYEQLHRVKRPSEGLGSARMLDLVGMHRERDLAVMLSHDGLRRGGERQLEHVKLVRRGANSLDGG